MQKSQSKLLLVSLIISSQILWAGPPAGTVVEWGNKAAPISVVPPPQFPAGFITIAGKVLHDATRISEGRDHCLALRDDGTVVAWGGENQYGERTVPVGLKNIMGISAGVGFSLALKIDGTVVAWGFDGPGSTVPTGLSNVVAISAGARHSLALKRDGTVVGWGSLFPPPDGLSNVVAIFARHSIVGRDMALKSNGTVVEWKLRGLQSVTSGPAGLSNVVAIAGGEQHSLALLSDGTVADWGFYGNGFGGGGGGSGDASQDYASNCLVRTSGRVLDNVIAIAARAQTSMALRKDGTVVVWSRNGFHIPDVPPGLGNVIAIATSGGHFLAITTNSPLTVTNK